MVAGWHRRHPAARVRARPRSAQRSCPAGRPKALRSSHNRTSPGPEVRRRRVRRPSPALLAARRTGGPSARRGSTRTAAAAWQRGCRPVARRRGGHPRRRFSGPSAGRGRHRRDGSACRWRPDHSTPRRVRVPIAGRRTPSAPWTEWPGGRAASSDHASATVSSHSPCPIAESRTAVMRGVSRRVHGDSSHVRVRYFGLSARHHHLRRDRPPDGVDL